MIRAFALVLMLFLWQGHAFAQDCAGPLKLIVGLAPGGGNDVVARLVAASVTKRFGRTIVVENKTGASGNIAAEYVARAPHDGCTITLRSNEHNVNPFIYARAGYVPADFTPIIQLVRGPGVIAANPGQPFKTLTEMVEYARSHPGKLSYGSSGIGGGNHVAAETFLRAAHLDILHVPYKGAALAMQDLIAGNVPLAVGSVASAMPYIQSGKIIPLAVTGPRRWPTLPNVPTVGEAGFPDATITYWGGLLAPAGTPKSAIDKLNQEFRAALEEEAIKEKLLSIGYEPVGGSPQDFDAFLQEDLRSMRTLLQGLNIKVE
jgi:tripartite-type tricarboxylate transporter receptor subunit TctC